MCLQDIGVKNRKAEERRSSTEAASANPSLSSSKSESDLAKVLEGGNVVNFEVDTESQDSNAAAFTSGGAEGGATASGTDKQPAAEGAKDADVGADTTSPSTNGVTEDAKEKSEPPKTPVSKTN